MNRFPDAGILGLDNLAQIYFVDPEEIQGTDREEGILAVCAPRNLRALILAGGKFKVDLFDSEDGERQFVTRFEKET
ncbi:MAG TPA: hypothetical protein VD947_01815 [Patescibacteria group bacterium]|nr:hypothetical protein [Patescibacteria group bacterium]